MKVVILTGGTGSIALQRGLYQSLEAHVDGVDVKIIVNAYDNGLSTGVVRGVMDGRILGPSDVRKNQATRLRLMNSGDPWLGLLERRFTCDSARAHAFCKDEVARFLALAVDSDGADHHRDVLFYGIDEFFKRPLSRRIEYRDFSLANVIYAGLASANGNSLRATARIMAGILGIPDNVILNDDKSLYLGAITSSGKRIRDEGDIVSWGNEQDPFVDVFFLDHDENDTVPELCFEAWHAIVEADLIILSSGTQWSSLIPTYASRGFAAAIRDSEAMVVLVVNRTPDRDSPGLTASGIVDLLVPRYFSNGRLHVLADKNGHPNMTNLGHQELSKVASFTRIDLSSSADPLDKHDAAKLAHAIGYVFFREYIDSSLFLFDYDDTLVGRENSCPKSSQFNVRMITWLNGRIDVGICTGNTIRALDLRGAPATPLVVQEVSHRPLLVFADGGANEYAYDTRSKVGACDHYRMVGCIAPEAVLPSDGQHSARCIIDGLTRAGIPAWKIEDRGNAVIAIKPIAKEQRRTVISLARHLVYGSDLEVRECGRTTIEIRKPTLSKICALKHLCAGERPPTITYVGDECDSGNDRDILRLSTEGSGIKCLHVDGPAKTAFFVSTLISHLGNGSR